MYRRTYTSQYVPERYLQRYIHTLYIVQNVKYIRDIHVYMYSVDIIMRHWRLSVVEAECMQLAATSTLDFNLVSAVPALLEEEAAWSYLHHDQPPVLEVAVTGQEVGDWSLLVVVLLQVHTSIDTKP